MAAENLSPALPSPAHPLANPGYGKRGVTDPSPLRRDSFAHLPTRARYLAGFIDALPEQAAMDIKTLADSQPLYGQAAVSSGLRELSAAGHLRRVQCVSASAAESGTTRWVFHTYWSRTARTDEWWTRFLNGDTPDPELGSLPGPKPGPEPKPLPEPKPGPDASPAASPAAAKPPTHSEAYSCLARLGLRDPRLTLSAADCATLEPLAADWLAREPDAERFTYAMTSGLPESVHLPRAFLARRLRDKLPPECVRTPETPGPVPAHRILPTLVECTDCGRPGRPEALPGGLCRPCRAAEDQRSSPAAGQVQSKVGTASATTGRGSSHQLDVEVVHVLQGGVSSEEEPGDAAGSEVFEHGTGREQQSEGEKREARMAT
ncbi:hypothetical protein [Streptomyces sp. KLOTTS4A1]|uniref:hypothetical protein n=1 Tax=Streptomyces sp. KLOTTS4A1 TaxID=3390996 RepID=UPI0039F4D033